MGDGDRLRRCKGAEVRDGLPGVKEGFLGIGQQEKGKVATNQSLRLLSCGQRGSV